MALNLVRTDAEDVDAALSFIVYGDSCSGVAGTEHARNLVRIHQQILRVEPRPPLLVFMGDHIAGYCEAEQLRKQWRYFFAEEFAAIAAAFPLRYHLTSNHSLYDRESVEIWREVFAFLPENGPPGQDKLAYWVRHDDALLIFVNTLGATPTGEARLESAWLDEVLAANSDASLKLVFGHHPIRAVNGYDRYPMWRVDLAEGEQFWEILRRHRVAAYFCSHVIAFDVQVHQGVLQICTAGAGTRYGPGGAMPGDVEYLHFAQVWASPTALRVQSRDVDGRIRETTHWPIALPPHERWAEIGEGDSPQGVAPGERLGEKLGDDFVAFRLRADAPAPKSGQDQILLCGWTESDAAPRLQASLCGGRLTLSLVPELGRHPLVWLGPIVPSDRPFDALFAIRPNMGPGGCLAWGEASQVWSSMTTAGAEGAASLIWPDRWSIGHGPSGPTDRPFRGAGLRVDVAVSA